MKTFFIIYLIGFILSGVIYKLLCNNESFYNFRVKVIEEAKRQMNDPITNAVDNDYLIRSDVNLTMFLSLIGLLKIFILVVCWYFDGKIWLF